MRKAYIFLLAFIAWTILFWYHYVYNIHQLGATPSEPAAITIPDPSSEKILPKQILFKPVTYAIVSDQHTSALVDSIVNLGEADQLLQITGFNTTAEQIGLDFDLGLARAAELKKLLIESLPENRIEIYSDTISTFVYHQDSLIEAVTYQWIDGYSTAEPTNYYLINHSSKRVKTEDYEALLASIAERLVESGEKVIIRGHTDSSGDSELNFTIGLRNAKDVRDVFKEKGVQRNQIQTTTSGEEMPIADNESDRGRIDNRRIEIEIIEN